MNTNPKEILIEVLNIIGYSEDKNIFVDKFIELCVQQALTKLIIDLTEEQQKSLKEELQNKTDFQEIVIIIQKYINPQKTEEILKQTSSNLFEDYLKTIMPELNKEQSEKLTKYLNSLENGNKLSN